MAISLSDFVSKNYELVYSNSWQEVDWNRVDLICLGRDIHCSHCEELNGKLISEMARKRGAISLFLPGIPSMEEIVDPERIQSILKHCNLQPFSSSRFFGCDADQEVLEPLKKSWDKRQFYLDRLDENEAQIRNANEQLAERAQGFFEEQGSEFDPYAEGEHRHQKIILTEWLEQLEYDRIRYEKEIEEIEQLGQQEFPKQTQAQVRTFEQIRESRSKGEMRDLIVCIWENSHWKVPEKDELVKECKLEALYAELAFHKYAIVLIPEGCPNSHEKNMD